MFSGKARGENVPDRHAADAKPGRHRAVPAERHRAVAAGSRPDGPGSASADPLYRGGPAEPLPRGAAGEPSLHGGAVDPPSRGGPADPPLHGALPRSGATPAGATPHVPAARPPQSRATRQGAEPHGGSPADDDRPARFSDALAVGEFRTIYIAGILSWIGDYVARAAVTALVYHLTGSAAAAAAAFAITYAPWLLGGSVLVAMAERYPYRSVMIVCDVARMTLMASVAIPGLPLPVVLALLLGSAFFSPPFDAARSATLPAVLKGDRYVVGVALVAATTQPVQVAGYVAGSAIAAINPRIALLINAATFGVSAIMLRLGVRRRDAALARERRSHLLRETVDGFRLVFGTPALRHLVLLVFSATAFTVVPEGLGAPWAAEISTPQNRGLAQGMIMAAVPFGSILGALVVSRLLRPAVRRRMLGVLAIATPLPLAVTVIGPPPMAVAMLAALAGVAFGGLLPVANGEFVKVLPNEYRARAFGVVSGGLQLLQGAVVLITGALATHFASVALVVGSWSLAGVVLMVSLVRPWSGSVMGAARGRLPASVPGTMEP